MKWILTDTPTGFPTIKVIKLNKTFFIHSSYDPLKEAQRWVSGLQITKENAPDYFVLVGMGAGYHVRALHEAFPNTPIYVWEFNEHFASWINRSGIISWIKENSKVTYKATESLQEIQKSFLPQILENNTILLIHPPTLDIIPQSLLEVKLILDEHLQFIRSLRYQNEILRENFTRNITLKDQGILKWIDKYKNRPMLLISAGPSLTKKLDLIQKIRKQSIAILGSVGTALSPLLDAEIEPDFVVVSDPQPGINEQINKVHVQGLPLFYLSTANADAISSYRGTRYIMWQQGYPEAEMQASNRGEPMIQTGGSVATCLLDLMVIMGGNPIALVGQDLAFTGGFSHAKNTHAVRKINNEIAYIEVTDFYKKCNVKTSKSLYSFKRWFERYAQKYPDPKRYWNCTEGGAFINGWIHAKLEDFFKNVTS